MEEYVNHLKTNKQMEKYNLDKLIKVKCYDFFISRYYCYRKEKKLLWFITQKEGIYTSWLDEYYGFKVPENHILKNETVYEIPEVVLTYNDNITKRYYFNTFEEAKQFANQLTSNGRWLE